MSSPKILVVEDNLDIRETLKLWLTAEGYDVQEAGDGIDALALLKTPPLPDLILLDMLMPRMNGWELVDTLKSDPNALTARIPIIALTATADKVQRSPGELEGVLRKPFELEALDALLRQFLPKGGSGSLRQR